MGGFFKSGLTGGLAKVHYKVAVPGGQALLRIQDPCPTFYFYFAVKAGSFGSAGGMGGWPLEPERFRAGRAGREKDQREVVVGQMGIQGDRREFAPKIPCLLILKVSVPESTRSFHERT